MTNNSKPSTSRSDDNVEFPLDFGSSYAQRIEFLQDSPPVRMARYSEMVGFKYNCILRHNMKFFFFRLSPKIVDTRTLRWIIMISIWNLQHLPHHGYRK